jgi:hypothetical protein
VILGFGLGYGAEAAARAAPDRPLINVERRKEVVRGAQETRDLGALLSRDHLAFVVGGNGAGAVQQALDLFGDRGPAAIIRNRTLMAADEEWYAGVEQGITTRLNREEVNRATLRRFGRRWVRNLARNMEAVRDLPGIARLAGALAGGGAGGKAGGAAGPGGIDPMGPQRPPDAAGPGIPVFLAAAGPSLDRTAPFLEEIRKRCVVVAVDTSLRFLLDRGLDPDFAVVVDPQYWNARHLDRCKAGRTWLIAESAVYPPVLRHGFRGAFLCRSLFPLGCFIEDRVDPKGALGAGGSVATSAWDFARVLGAPSIWIAGLDLAFPGRKTHFRGALFETRAQAESTRLVPAETWSVRALREGRPFLAAAAEGGRVLTDQRLSLYASWFAGRFREYPALRNYRLAFPGQPPGIAIPGLENAGPEAILELPERRGDIEGLLEGLGAKIREDFRRGAEDRARSYREARARLLGGLEGLAEEAAAAAALARNSLRNGAGRGSGPGRAAEEERILRKLDAALRSIKTSEVKDVAGFLFPSPEELGREPEAGGAALPAEGAGRGGESPFARFLELSGRTYQALAEAAGYQLGVLRRGSA